MFVDEVNIKVTAGSGGDGCTAFRREKYVELGGPFGGNGGRGSNIIFKVDEGLRTLVDLRYNKIIKGERGANGEGKNKNGKGAKDIVIKVPPGTVVRDLDTNLLVCDLKNNGEEYVVAKGGRGGRGNEKSESQQFWTSLLTEAYGKKWSIKSESACVAELMKMYQELIIKQ